MDDPSTAVRRFLRWSVGAARITRVVDLEASGLAFLLPAATPDNLSRIEWIAPYLVSSGEAVAAIQSFVIEVGGRRVLVDTAAGERARSEIPARIELAESYLTDLEAAGFAPETIDTVIHTHLHFDHVGYNLKPMGHGFVPTFPNARHLVVSNEWNHWSGGAADEERAPVERAIRPLMEAERVDLVAPWQEVAPGVLLEPTPGHTPGHVSVRIRSGAEQALLSGDVMHHPAQLARPDWTCTWDVDPELACATRRRFLAECAASGALVIGTHFAHAPAGHVVRDGAVFRFEPSASAP